MIAGVGRAGAHGLEGPRVGQELASGSVGAEGERGRGRGAREPLARPETD